MNANSDDLPAPWSELPATLTLSSSCRRLYTCLARYPDVTGRPRDVVRCCSRGEVVRVGPRTGDVDGGGLAGGRKERRRFSLLSYRRFLGDYLDINGKSALGEELASACGTCALYILSPQ